MLSELPWHVIAHKEAINIVCNVLFVLILMQLTYRVLFYNT